MDDTNFEDIELMDPEEYKEYDKLGLLDYIWSCEYIDLPSAKSEEYLCEYDEETVTQNQQEKIDN